MLPPFWNPPYRDDDLRHIAGFVAHTRQRILRALASVNDPATEEAPEWREAMIAYWSSGEVWTRWMLYDLGYPVKAGQQYDVEEGSPGDGP